MADEESVVIAVYTTYGNLEAGVLALKSAGFRNSSVSVIYPEKRKTSRSPRAEKAAARANEGALVGGVLGWLAGAGSLVIPGIAPLIAVGPIVSRLRGENTTGTVNGIAGGLASLGISESEALAYEARLKAGGALLSVHPDNAYWATRAREIMEKSGAVNIRPGGEPEPPA